ncbi:hypothetical protein BGX31_007243 [Mortierella sp. GBA43]|nr:hypothetical protein BGX31_007243 [Mortierella sp. GBA43]
MTEKKPRKEAGVAEDTNMRHDGILYHNGLRKVLLAIEAKRHDRGHHPYLRDMEKLEYALSTMLRALGGDPSNKRSDKTPLQHMRSFGILISEFNVTFLELRYQAVNAYLCDGQNGAPNRNTSFGFPLSAP